MKRNARRPFRSLTPPQIRNGHGHCSVRLPLVLAADRRHIPSINDASDRANRGPDYRSHSTMSADRLAWCACPTEEEFWNSSGTPRTRCAIRQRQHPDLVTLKSLGQKLELRTAWFYSMHSKKPISPLHTMPSPLQMFWILTPSRGTRRGVAVKRSQPFRQRSAIDSDDAIRRRGAVPRAWRSPRPSFNRPKSRRLLLQGIMPAIVVVLLKESWHQPTQMGLVPHDHVVQQFPATAPHPVRSKKSERSPRLSEQRGGLRHPLPRYGRNLTHPRRRSPAPGRLKTKEMTMPGILSDDSEASFVQRTVESGPPYSPLAE